eukprot:363069-Chlamydomonas_euryale.AAC.3
MLAAINSAPEGASHCERCWLEEKVLDAVGEEGWYQMEEMAEEAETESDNTGSGIAHVAFGASEEWLQRMRPRRGPDAWCGDAPRWQTHGWRGQALGDQTDCPVVCHCARHLV